MKWRLVSLAIAVLPLWGASAAAALTPVAVYLQFQEQPTPVVLKSLQAEVESIMEPIGLRFHWGDATKTDGRLVSVELAVVDFIGRCDLQGLTPRDSNPGPLGWTRMSDGAIIPFADVDCSAVRGFIQRELLITPASQRAHVFGRALGRVLAHELFHIFADTTQHGVEGVARESYTQRELLSAEFQFDRKDSAVLSLRVPRGAAGDDEHRDD